MRTDQPIPQERPESFIDDDVRFRYCGSPLRLIFEQSSNSYLDGYEYDLDHWTCTSCSRRFSLEEANAYRP